MESTVLYYATWYGKVKLCAVSGRIQSGSYLAKEGSRRYTTDVVADIVQFLEWDKEKESSSAENDMSDIDGFYTIDNDDIPFN